MKRKAEVMDSLTFSPMGPERTDVESTQVTILPCYTALPKDDCTPLEFKIDRSDAFIDLKTSYLEVVVQILKSDGSEIKTEMNDKGVIVKQELVAPVNNIGCALFENVDLYVHDQRITNYDSNYAWWTYVYNLLYRDQNAKHTWMRGGAWFEDTAAVFDTVTMKEEEEFNKGFRDRYSVFHDSQKVTLFVPVMLNKHFDRLLPPQTELLLRYSRAPVNFSLMAKKGSSFKIKIWNARLFVTRVTLTDSGLRNYERLLSSRGYSYPVDATYVKTRTVSKGDQNVDWVPFTGTLPKRLFFFQITHEAYNSSIHKNPYNFQSFQINKFQVFKNGLCLPISSGFTDIQNDKYQELYQYSLKSINSDACTISYQQFPYGYTIIAVDLTSSLNSNEISGSDTGNVRLVIDYANPLAGSITLFCLAQFDEVLKIDRNRTVTIS